jgi:hypothetical protein
LTETEAGHPRPAFPFLPVLPDNWPLFFDLENCGRRAIFPPSGYFN